AFFEGDVQITGNKDDHHYALVYEKFWTDMLPSLEEASRLQKQTAKDPMGVRGAVTSFGYCRDEVDKVLREYQDPSGRIMRTQMQHFRRQGSFKT
ncbi:unnamed protein product, partial [Choristocarpus tenellus]